MAGILVANRGEIAIRVMRAAGELGQRSVAVYARDDAASLHARRADEAHELPGSGVAGYLDAEQILAAARDTGCTAIHPGYGFLSEKAAFAARCVDERVTFIGPRPDLLDLFGDKARSRALAQRLDVPVVAGTAGPTSMEEARAFLEAHGAVMLKALAGGGGRGIRAVRDPGGLPEAFERCRSEALQAFGNGDLYVEQLLPTVRHIEVQIAGDGSGAVSHLGERDCSIQRRHQKLIEVAPSPALAEPARERILAAACHMAEEVRYANLGTFEFLVDTSGEAFWFIEANPRLQVEHTVTEEVTGVDLVQAQIKLAQGASIVDVGPGERDVPRLEGFALQARVNLETVDPDGTPQPQAGALTSFTPPSGPGVRVDTYGYAGYHTSVRYDPLLAKVIARSDGFPDLATKAHRALGEFDIAGVATNIPFLRTILRHPDVIAARWNTAFVADHLTELLPSPETRLHADRPDVAEGGPITASPPTIPLDGVAPVLAPLQGTVVSVDVMPGDFVRTGGQLVVLEAMKMEHVVAAKTGGVIRDVAVTAGESVTTGTPLLFVEATGATADAGGDSGTAEVDLEKVRADLAEVRHRHEIGFDDARPEAVRRRHSTGHRTARENIDDLCDPDSFVEYGGLAIAAQRQRRSLDDLISRTPADGLVTGVGRVNGEQCAVMSYDYTVLAGTQGYQNHRKTDRLFELAEQRRLPVVIFTEGGGGRPGDTDTTAVSGLDVMSFHTMGRLSGLVPLVGITSGRCFAGNAALLGCCDVIIATHDANIGMGGPAMIEGGGLGTFAPEEVGPTDVQVPNGVVDIPVTDEAEAVQIAQRYLSYFQGTAGDWTCADQRYLRHVIPENRLRVYDARCVIEYLADSGSVLELRRGFGAGIVTTLVRVEGRPLGLIANNPAHLGGAIDRDAADKAARFMQLCDAFGIPIVSLCDTPGFMVGPATEHTAAVRHFSRLFVTGANLSVPLITVVLRKGYGLGAQAMAGGSFKAPLAAVAWPTGELGGMGLEGAVRLGYRKELEAIEDPQERQALFDQMVATAYEHGKVINAASVFELDDVIDPADTRRWITMAVGSTPATPSRAPERKTRPHIDTW